MPWRGAEVEGEYPTLAYEVGGWIESHCVIPDGVHQGEPYQLTDEMWRFLFAFYRLREVDGPDPHRPSAAFVHRGGLLMRPQKWGKGPLAAAICLTEAFGPVRFAGWDGGGEPVGVPQPSPWVQIVATSEEQTDNTWLALYEMATRGAVADFPGVDIGVEDINLPSGGKIEPRTSSGRARLGARLTFGLFDETGLMTESNGGVLLATTMKRNIGGMGGRWLETTNAYDPSENSVAQRTHESAAPGVVKDYRPAPARVDLDDDAEALAALAHVYGDSWWVDHDRILEDARDVAVCPHPADALRFFFNRLEVGQHDAVDATRWAAKVRPRDLAPREMVCLGFDGSRSLDCTSLVASRVRDGRWFHLRTWDPAVYPDHKVPRPEVDLAVEDAFEGYDVRFLFGDPYLWSERFDLWSARWPDRVVEVPTNVDKRMDLAVTRFQTVFAGEHTHDGDPVLTDHVLSAAIARGRRRDPRPGEDPSRPHFYQKVIKKRGAVHIDGFIAGLLAEVARGHAIESGALTARVPVPATARSSPAGADGARALWRPTSRLTI